MAPPYCYASASAESISYSGYDVFLSHRGPDVKDTFASHLYRRLIICGLRVFLDRPEMVEGRNITAQIEAAIREASVHIAIFSENYAESSWCLEELALMLHSRATILPVFYKVKPSELRWTGKDNDGVYAKALRIHEEKKRHDLQTIQRWRDALYLVAGISGFELKNCNGDEGELVDKIVQRVLKMQDVNTPLIYVTEHPTGLKEKLQELESTVLQQHSGKANVVGVVGPGGIGKSTLAKQFFNTKRAYYSRACFLYDIREETARGCLKSLQRKLLKELTQLDLPIDNIDEGIEKLRKHLSSSHVLIILDDVDRASQLDAFLPIKDVLASDSLILITSRDKKVLKRASISERSIYKPAVLNRSNSLQLFCSYAFLQPYPLPGFEELVDGFLTACNGLPLSLKVFGALLYEEDDKSHWQGQLDRLHQTLPEDIEKRLRISYDSLIVEEQEIFLDIACFFIGEEKDTTVRIWGLVGVQNLENKCLLEVDIENKIRMHDHLRDLGRKIAKERSRPRRLWHSSTSNIYDSLDQSTSVRTGVRGIKMVPRVSCPEHITVIESSLFCSQMSRFKRCRDEVFLNHKCQLADNDGSPRTRNLQFVATEDDYLKGILSRVPSPDLLWLCWYKCPYNSLPSWIPLQNLRVIDLAGDRLSRLWRHKSQAPLQLRELNVWAPLSHFPKSIGQLQNLEKIVLDCFVRHSVFETLPDEFCQLRSLKYLHLARCMRMMSLPESFGNLTNLKHLHLSEAYSLQMLPISFGNLRSLKKLLLTTCPKLTCLPDSVGAMSQLTVLKLWNVGIQSLPQGLMEMENLDILEMEHCKFRHLNGLGYLQLSKIKISGCDDLLGVGVFPTTLITLNLSSCRGLRKIEGLSGLAKLQRLDISGCPELEELPNLETLISLEVINAFQCEKVRRIRGLAPLIKLRILQVDGCYTITELRDIKYLNSLKELRAGRCCNLKSIEGLAQLTNLRILDVHGCRKIKELPGVQGLVLLEELRASRCYKLEGIGDSMHSLALLRKLRILDVHECHEIRKLRGVEQLMSLEKLDVTGCHKLQWDRGALRQLRQRLKRGLCEGPRDESKTSFAFYGFPLPKLLCKDKCIEDHMI